MSMANLVAEMVEACQALLMARVAQRLGLDLMVGC